MVNIFRSWKKPIFTGLKKVFSRSQTRFLSKTLSSKPKSYQRRFLAAFEKRISTLEKDVGKFEIEMGKLNSFFIVTLPERINGNNSTQLLASIKENQAKLLPIRKRFDKLTNIGKASFEEFNYSKLNTSSSPNNSLSKIHTVYRIIRHLEDELAYMETELKKRPKLIQSMRELSKEIKGGR